MFEQPTPTSELLEDIADEIEDRGFAKGTWSTRADGTSCTLKTAANVVWSHPAHRELDRDQKQTILNRVTLYIRRRVKTWIPGWNDQAQRTQQDLLDEIRGASKDARRDEEGLDY